MYRAREDASSTVPSPDLSLHIGPPATDSTPDSTHLSLSNVSSSSWFREPDPEAAAAAKPQYCGLSASDLCFASKPIDGTPIYLNGHQHRREECCWNHAVLKGSPLPLDYQSHASACFHQRQQAPPAWLVGLSSSAPSLFSCHRHDLQDAFRREMTMRSRLILSSGYPAVVTKRSTRAPRMRWTSGLHDRFVHAVDLLGGHESTYANFD